MFGHAVHAAEIAAVRDRHPQIGDRSREGVDEGGCLLHPLNLGARTGADKRRPAGRGRAWRARVVPETGQKGQPMRITTALPTLILTAGLLAGCTQGAITTGRTVAAAPTTRMTTEQVAAATAVTRAPAPRQRLAPLPLEPRALARAALPRATGGPRHRRGRKQAPNGPSRTARAPRRPRGGAARPQASYRLRPARSLCWGRPFCSSTGLREMAGQPQNRARPSWFCHLKMTAATRRRTSMPRAPPRP